MSDKAREIFSKALENATEENVGLKVQYAMAEMNKQILKDFPLDLRLNCLIGLVNKSIQEGNNVDYKVVNELLAYDVNGYSYNLFDEVKSLKDLIELRDMIIQAEIIDGDYRKCTCKKCKEPFTLAYGEVEFYKNKNFPLPKTCKYCRKGIEKPKKIEPKQVVKTKEEHIPTAMEIALRNIKID